MDAKFDKPHQDERFWFFEGLAWNTKAAKRKKRNEPRMGRGSTDENVEEI